MSICTSYTGILCCVKCLQLRFFVLLFFLAGEIKIDPIYCLRNQLHTASEDNQCVCEFLLRFGLPVNREVNTVRISIR